ncbi:hypothetical protein C0993_010128 [Termitomyces sp. T159_Od127]|nr:hypothetical protein C0993_010128 [Termitomyces sp. T159_Od127]
MSPAVPAHAAIENRKKRSSSTNRKKKDEESIRSEKRRKQSTSNASNLHPSLQLKNVRGRRGALKDIVEMPLDILQEIFMYLTSGELLSLSRMCKALRRMLMTKSAEKMWKQARLNLDDELPECPDDLNEVQFANLIFTPLCDGCKKAKGRYYMWSIRRCYCFACLTDKKGLIRAYANQLLGKFQRLRKSDDRQVWIQEVKDTRERRITHGHLCEQWLKIQAQKRGNELDKIRQRRYEAIKQRLTDLGWEKDLKTIEGMTSWPSVNQPKDLTDRVWQNIKDDIIEKMEEHKARRLEREYLFAQSKRRHLLSNRVHDLQTNIGDKVIFPNHLDLESKEPVSTLIKAPTEETIDFSESVILESIENWRTSCETVLRNMVVTSTTPTSGLNGVNPLLLATTFFSCDRNCDEFQYPEVLKHKCATLGNFRHESCLWNPFWEN